MQQKFCSRGSLLLERISPACTTVTDPSLPSCDLPFRCPECGERERFHSLTSLHVHLEHRHSFHSPDVISGSFSITGKLPDPLMAAIPWYDMSLPTSGGQQSTMRPPHVRFLGGSRDPGCLCSYSCARRHTNSVVVGTHGEEEEGEVTEVTKDEDEEDRNEGTHENENIYISTKKSDTNQHHYLFSPLGQPPALDLALDLALDPDLDVVEQKSSPGLQTSLSTERRGLSHVLWAADSTMQRRLASVRTELAHTDTELLCERAHSEHLIQERQEVAERQRSLSRQVDVAVLVIAALREQINASENELERREREAITIQKFLETAARQEMSGKVRIQRFIENLLRRIDMAERLVEFYQVNSSTPHDKKPTENGHHRIMRSRSALGPSSFGLHGNRTHSSSQFSGCASLFKVVGDQEHRERLAQSSKLFCRPEHRDDIWNYRRR